MKFKTGDRVRIVKNRSETIENNGKYVGMVCTISEVHRSFRGDRCYSLVEEPDYVWFDDELELLKEKFDISNYPGMYAMRCETEEQAKIFCKYLDSVGRTWTSGARYTDGHTNYGWYKSETAYAFNVGEYLPARYYRDTLGYTILEFDNFDWSDFTMGKKFTKKDLKNGDVIKRRNGTVEIVCADTGTLICKNGWNALNSINVDLTYSDECDDLDIVAVRRPTCASDCQFDAFFSYRGRLVYERKEAEEMTLEEVCKALGKDIKIVKSK